MQMGPVKRLSTHSRAPGAIPSYVETADVGWMRFLPSSSSSHHQFPQCVRTWARESTLAASYLLSPATFRILHCKSWLLPSGHSSQTFHLLYIQYSSASYTFYPGLFSITPSRSSYRNIQNFPFAHPVFCISSHLWVQHLTPFIQSLTHIRFHVSSFSHMQPQAPETYYNFTQLSTKAKIDSNSHRRSTLSSLVMHLDTLLLTTRLDYSTPPRVSRKSRTIRKWQLTHC